MGWFGNDVEIMFSKLSAPTWFIHEYMFSTPGFRFEMPPCRIPLHDVGSRNKNGRVPTAIFIIGDDFQGISIYGSVLFARVMKSKQFNCIHQQVLFSRALRTKTEEDEELHRIPHVIAPADSSRSSRNRLKQK